MSRRGITTPQCLSQRMVKRNHKTKTVQWTMFWHSPVMKDKCFSSSGYGEKDDLKLKDEKPLEDLKRVEYMASHLSALLSAVR